MIETTLNHSHYDRIETLIDWNHTATHETDPALLDIAISQVPVLIEQLTAAGVPTGIIIAALNISAGSMPTSHSQTISAFYRHGYIVAIA